MVMNQKEIKELFQFCEDTIKTYHADPCDESTHMYIGDVCIGGWAGDRQEFFFEHSNVAAKAIRMMDASKSIDVESETAMGF
jgi:hypothetical protein